MICANIFAFLLCIYAIYSAGISSSATSPAPASFASRPASLPSNMHTSYLHAQYFTSMSWNNYCKLSIVFFAFLFFTVRYWLLLCYSVRYVPLGLLGMCPKLTQPNHCFTPGKIYIFGTLLILSELECAYTCIYFILLHTNCFNDNLLDIFSKSKYLLPSKYLLCDILAFTIFYYAETKISHYYCISLLYTAILSIIKDYPDWLFDILILLSHDVHMNPGPRDYRNNFLQFMNWNLNSLAKDNFSRLKLIEAHNSIFNYDIISLCETSLTKGNEPSVPDFEGYTFVPASQPDDAPHGDVGLFYKDSLPVIVRKDLAFDESIVLELKFQRKKFSLLFYIGALLTNINLQSLKNSSLISKHCTPISNPKNRTPCFLLAISTLIPNYGGLKGIQMLREKRSMIFSPH